MVCHSVEHFDCASNLVERELLVLVIEVRDLSLMFLICSLCHSLTSCTLSESILDLLQAALSNLV